MNTLSPCTAQARPTPPRPVARSPRRFSRNSRPPEPRRREPARPGHLARGPAQELERGAATPSSLAPPLQHARREPSPQAEEILREPPALLVELPPHAVARRALGWTLLWPLFHRSRRICEATVTQAALERTPGSWRPSLGLSCPPTRSVDASLAIRCLPAQRKAAERQPARLRDSCASLGCAAGAVGASSRVKALAAGSPAPALHPNAASHRVQACV